MNDNETIEKELLLENNQEQEVFVYVNPLKGNHVKLRDSEKIAVFRDEVVGRTYEKISQALNNCVGYYVVWSEMLTIANQETGGKYEYFSNCV